jgi:hypothetical protein
MRCAINVYKNCKYFWYFLFGFTYFHNTDFLCQNELSEVIMNVFYNETKNVRFIGFFFK